MTIADTLHDAAEEIRDYLNDDGLESYGGLAREIMHVAEMMDGLRARLDGLGAASQNLNAHEQDGLTKKSPGSRRGQFDTSTVSDAQTPDIITRGKE